MRPTFSTEIGRMRAEEMRQRAERYRKAAMATKHGETEEPPVVTERRGAFSLRRLFAVATGTAVLMVGMATAASAAVPAQPGWGDGGGYGGPVVSIPETTTTVPTVDLAPFLVVGAFVLAALVTAWFVRRTPRIA